MSLHRNRKAEVVNAFLAFARGGAAALQQINQMLAESHLDQRHLRIDAVNFASQDTNVEFLRHRLIAHLQRNMFQPQSLESHLGRPMLDTYRCRPEL
jgi:hypothetical protein